MNTEPKYIFKTNEAVLVSKNSKLFSIIKVTVWVVVAILLIGSVLFQDNLFAELDGRNKVILIILAIGVTFFGKREDVPSEIQLQFFDDHLIIFRPKRFYSKRVTRMEVNKMMYSDITKCVIKEKSKRVHIYGDVSAKWYNFDSRDVVSPTPTYDRLVKDTLCYFSTRCATDVDFKRVIEENSPIRVIVEDK